jgi:hypothetical protein
LYYNGGQSYQLVASASGQVAEVIDEQLYLLFQNLSSDE